MLGRYTLYILGLSLFLWLGNAALSFSYRLKGVVLFSHFSKNIKVLEGDNNYEN